MAREVVRISDEFWTNYLIRRLEAEGLEVPPLKASYDEELDGSCTSAQTRLVNSCNRGLVICRYISSVNWGLEEPSYTDFRYAVEKQLSDQVYVYFLPRKEIKDGDIPDMSISFSDKEGADANLFCKDSRSLAQKYFPLIKFIEPDRQGFTISATDVINNLVDFANGLFRGDLKMANHSLDPIKDKKPKKKM